MTTALIVAAIIAAVASVGVGVTTAVANKKSVEDTNQTNVEINDKNNAFSAEEAEKNRDWEEYMANTSIQRKAADYAAAGMNPAMAAVGGSVSNTPGAYAAQASNAAPMKAVDYSPLSQMSANLGHLVTSANRIAYLDHLAKRDPKTMGQLNMLSKGLVASTMSANSMDKLADIKSKYGLSESDIQSLQKNYFDL